MLRANKYSFLLKTAISGSICWRRNLELSRSFWWKSKSWMMCSHPSRRLPTQLVNTFCIDWRWSTGKPGFRFTQRAMGQQAKRAFGIALLVFDADREEIIQWIP